MSNAFEPMFDECVSIEPRNGMKTSRRCCIFLDNTSDPLSEDMSETNREDIILAFRDCDTKYINTLKRGDIVSRPETGGTRYSVQAVTRDFLLGLIVKAREINGR